MKKEIQELDSTDDKTSSLPLATVTELDITAQLPARNEDTLCLEGAEDSEAITAETIADEDTVEVPAKSGKTG